MTMIRWFNCPSFALSCGCQAEAVRFEGIRVGAKFYVCVCVFCWVDERASWRFLEKSCRGMRRLFVYKQASAALVKQSGVVKKAHCCW